MWTLLYGFLDSPFFLRQVSIEISLGTASQYTEMCFTKISFGDRFLTIFTFCCSSLMPFLLLWQKSKWQQISICKCEIVLTFDLDYFFVIWIGQIQSDLQTCNLQAGQSDLSLTYMFIKQFQLNLPHSNVKRFSRSTGKTFWHLKMNIFCHLHFWRNRGMA
jgi:hypothetical protein